MPMLDQLVPYLLFDFDAYTNTLSDTSLIPDQSNKT